jgi:nitroimidazol reductase NimA-like FMN-containing flavoprotein (pyridoxamine 5'-phosphate oxidase superfamily)
VAVTTSDATDRVDPSSSTSTSVRQSDRTTLRRHKERARYDRAEVHAVLDEGLVAHVAVVADGEPLVLPMVYARVGDRLYLHGALANHLLGTATGSVSVCFSVTLLDGLVLARSAFHHSVNFRSLVLFGPARLVDDPAEKHTAFAALVEHLVPGRSGATRMPSDAEVRSTQVVVLDIDEGSLKVRTGGPIDDEADLDLEVWAGVVPAATVFGQPDPDEGRPRELPVPDHVSARVGPNGS